MKKTYSNPTLIVMKVNAPQLMAGSDLGVNSTPVDNNNSDARRGWFDDGDDDE